MEYVDNIRKQIAEERRRGDTGFSPAARQAILEMDWDAWKRFVDGVLAPEDVVDDIDH